MSQAHCLDCGTEVPVDPLGHCPAGHLQPAHGRMVASAIGSDDHHPDEPEPWVVQVALATDEPEPAAPSAQPQAAPGLAPVEREANTGDLLRELGALGSDEEPEPRSSAPSTPAPSDPPRAPSDPPRAPSEEPGPTAAVTGSNGAGVPATAPTNGHVTVAAAANGNGAPAAGPSATVPAAPAAPAAPADEAPDPAVSEHSALEQAIQALDEPRAPSAASPPTPHDGVDDDELSALFDELEGVGSGNGQVDAPSPAPVEPSLPAPPPAAPDAAEPSRVDEARDAVPTRSGLDTMNFTAKGGAMDGKRRRRLFGR